MHVLGARRSSAAARYGGNAVFDNLTLDQLSGAGCKAVVVKQSHSCLYTLKDGSLNETREYQSLPLLKLLDLFKSPRQFFVAGLGSAI